MKKKVIKRKNKIRIVSNLKKVMNRSRILKEVKKVKMKVRKS